MYRDQNAVRSQNVKIDKGYFERVEQFEYLGTTLTYKFIFKKKLIAN